MSIERWRDIDCQKYSECLSKAAKVNIKQADLIMDCPKCKNDKVLKLENLDSKKLYDIAFSIRGNIEGKFWELGAILQRMFVSRFYYGYPTWEAFIRHDPLFNILDFGYRTVDYLRSINVKFTELGVSQSQCTKVSYTRLTKLLPVINKSNVYEWIVKAKKLTADEFQNELKKQTGEHKKPEKRFKPFSVSLSGDQLSNVNKALGLASLETKTSLKNVNLDFVCSEFMRIKNIAGIRR